MNVSMAKEGPLSGNPPVRSCDMQKYILLSPVLGPKPVLLSPMYDKADQSQARFVIVPMENKRRPSLCSIMPAASSPLLAIEDFTSCQLLQEEAKELVSRRTEEQEEMEEGEGGMLHKTRDTTMQMLTHSRQDPDKHSQIPMCVSLQRNNLVGSAATRGAPTMPRDHHMPDLLYNNKVNHPFSISNQRSCIIEDGLIFQSEMELKYDGGVDKNWGDGGDQWQSPREPPPHYPHHKVTVMPILSYPRPHTFAYSTLKM